MGRRDDNFIDDETLAAAIRRLHHTGVEPQQLAPPPDLVTRTLRRLPPQPPAAVARAETRRANTRRLLGVAVALMVVGLALSLVPSGSGTPMLALLLGDGGGLGRVLVALQLALKPLWRSMSLVDPLVLTSAAVAVCVGGWLWWRTVSTTPVEAIVEPGQ